jgi:hypothetical protein
MDEHEAIIRFLRRLYAKGALTIQEASSGAATELASSSCRDAEEIEPEISNAFELAVGHLTKTFTKRHYVPNGVTCPKGPILVLARELSPEEAEVLEKWQDDDFQGFDCGYGEGDYQTLDSIPWKYGPGWRKLYHRIPCCGEE